MQIEEVVEKLRSYNALKMQIKKLKMKADILAEDITELPALACSERVQTSNTRKVVEENTLKLIQEKSIVENRIKKKEDELKVIELGVSELPYYEQKIIQLRYFYKCSWRECEEQLGYSERYLQKIRKKALEDLKVFFEL